MVINKHNLKSSSHFLKDINETSMKFGEGFSASVYRNDNGKLHLTFSTFRTNI